MFEHYTAWLTTDPTCLIGDLIDVTVLADTIVTYDVDADGDETPVWESTGGPLCQATTSVPAKDGDVGLAMCEARELLDEAGWRVIGDWSAVNSGYVATVELRRHSVADAGDALRAWSEQ